MGRHQDRRKMTRMGVSTAAISSRTNARVKQLRAAFSGNTRLSGGLVAIEGDHLLEEALRSGIVPGTIFLSERRELPYTLPRSTEILRLTEDVFSSAVETRSPQGVAALIEPPIHKLEDILEQPSPLVLIAAGLQDPGNLGTLVRSVEAFGAAGVLTTPGTVSVWNQKALRASAGSVFRTPIVAATQAEVTQLQNRGITLLAAVGLQEDGVLSAHEADLSRACAIMIGNEGSGLAPEWLALASARITIPCPGPVESLNAAIAGSLLLYEASRQRAATPSAATTAQERIPGPLRRRPTGAHR
jgi:TrmH family RNA methyltransferase